MVSADRYFIAGIFFIALAILVIIRNVTSKKNESFFWFCDIAPFLLAIGFFMHNNQLIKGLVNIGFISQLISLFSLSAAVFFGIDIVGFAEILKESKFAIIVSFLLHSVSTTLGLVLTYNIKPQPASLVYSLVVLLIMLVLTLTFTKPKSNINYVYHADFLGIKLRNYSFFWITLCFVLVVLPTYLIQYLIYLWTI